MTSGFGSRSREGGRRGWDFVVFVLRDLRGPSRLRDPNASHAPRKGYTGVRLAEVKGADHEAAK